MPKDADRFQGVSSDVREHMRTALARGESAFGVAHWLQAQGLFTDLRHSALRKSVQRWRVRNVDVPEAARQKSIERAKHPALQAQLLRTAERFDFVGTHTTLVQDQLKRVAKLKAQEDKMPAGLTNNTLSREIKLLNELLATFSHLALETGWLRRAPRDLRALVAHTSPEFEERLARDVEHNQETQQMINEALALLRGVDEPKALEHKQEPVFIDSETGEEMVLTDLSQPGPECAGRDAWDTPEPQHASALPPY